MFFFSSCFSKLCALVVMRGCQIVFPSLCQITKKKVLYLLFCTRNRGKCPTRPSSLLLLCLYFRVCRRFSLLCVAIYQYGVLTQKKNIILPQGRSICTGRVDVRRCSCAFFFSQLLVLFYALWRLFAYTSTSCVPFFFCSNKCFYLHRGKCFSQSPVVHKVLRYQRDSFFFFTRVLRGNIYQFYLYRWHTWARI